MRFFAGCILSAVLACLLTVCFFGPSPQVSVTAQERGKQRGPGFSSGPRDAELPPRPATALAESLFNEEGLTPEEAVAVAVYDAVNRSVVNITTRSARTSGFLLAVPTEDTGSGSVLDKEGHILTNYHVIEGARQVAVTLYNGETYDATFVGADSINDIAVLKVEAPKDELHPVVLGDSRKLRVGMRVFALGNPFGLERTLTTGIISSINRSLQIHSTRTIKSIIQIDAAINPGNSGGPLLDAHGRLIGINTAIASSTGQSSGVGFAIPVSLVSRVVPQLLKHGRVIRPDIGIARIYETDNGLLIAELKAGGAAEQAGLRGPQTVRTRRGPFVLERLDRTAADLIVAVDDQSVKTGDEFLDYIESKRPGDQVILTIVRDERKMQVLVILGGGEEPAAK